MRDPLGFYLLAGLGIFGAGLALNALRTGQYAFGDVTRVDHPAEFWKRFAKQSAFGALMLALAVWKLLDRGPRVQARDACEGYASSLDCFFGEYFLTTLLTLISVGGSIGWLAWQWRKRRQEIAQQQQLNDSPHRDDAG